MEPGIREQLELEDNMVRRGVERTVNRRRTAETADRGADTDYARKLIKAYLGRISAGIQEFLDQVGPGDKGKTRPLLKQLSAEQSAYFVLRGVFNAFTKSNPVQAVAISIGRMVEDEVRFSRFQQQHRDYYDRIIEDFKRKGTKSYRHMHRVLTHKANEKVDGWNVWTDTERVLVGTKLIDIMRTTTQLVEVKQGMRKSGKVRPGLLLHPTAEAREWISRYVNFAEMLDPDRMPCIIEPDPWVSIDQGGYYSPQLRSRTPFVLNVRREHRKLLEAADLTPVFKAVNIVQSTPWKVNHAVLDVMKQVWDKDLGVGMPPSNPFVIPDCPLEKGEDSKTLTEAKRAAFLDWKMEAALLHTAEKERISKCFQVARAMRMAQEYRDYRKIWFVYQDDFRSRGYAAASGMSPQGSDVAKSLIHFAEGKRLTARGRFWLAVHGANVYGFDKAPYADRAAWVADRRAEIFALADDPLSHRDFWGNADKPWQFLAFALEYTRSERAGGAVTSYLPCAQDGSCNGLQHFSAMLRDDVGGRATNLVPSDATADIYGEVAGVCTGHLRSRSDPMAAKWLAFCGEHGDGNLPRAIAKRPVMTLPYGATKRACTDHIFKCIYETSRGYFKGTSYDGASGDFGAAMYLTEILWQSIGEVVVSARKAMDFVRDCAAVMQKQGKPLVWTTALGFPVYQGSTEVTVRQVDTQLCGRIQLRIASETNKLDLSKQKQGGPPNFVHSQDATHMMMTVLAAHKVGVTSFAMIHDDFGTHASDVDALHVAIRESFVKLYTKHDPLQDFRDGLKGKGLPNVPDRGKLDINGVMDAQFFFG